MRIKDTVGFAPLLTLTLALSFGSAKAQDEPYGAVPAVTAAVAVESEVLAVVPVSGSVKPYNEVFITPQLNGVQIRQVLVDPGDWVSVGDVLVRLRSDLYEAQLAQAEAEVVRANSMIRQAENQIKSTEASLAEAEADLERMRQLMDNGSISQATLDQAITRTEGARAAAASAQDQLAIAEASQAQADSQKGLAKLNLQWTDITTPVSGRVGQRNANVGALTSAGAPPLLTVYEGGTMELSAEVIETALGDIHPGDGADIVVAGVGELIGAVRMISSTVDQVTRLGEVRIGLQHNENLRAGLFGRGEIEIDRRMALTVPVTAVLSDDGGPYVQVIKDGTVEKRPVVPGLIWKDRREIVSGLEEGEAVIARAGAFFRNGDMVRVVEAGQ